MKVQEISASERAFTAILTTGRVISWGHLDYGACSPRETLNIEKWLWTCGATDSLICYVPQSVESMTVLHDSYLELSD